MQTRRNAANGTIQEKQNEQLTQNTYCYVKSYCRRCRRRRCNLCKRDGLPRGGERSGPHRHQGGSLGRQDAGHVPVLDADGFRHEGRRRNQRLQDDGQFGRGGHHLGHSPQAGHDPRGADRHERRHHEGRDRERHQVLAPRHHHRGCQPDGHANLPGPEGFGTSEEPHHRHGRRIGLGPLQVLPGQGHGR